MSLTRNLYFMSLVGGIAGLFAWILTVMLTSAVSTLHARWLADVTAATLLGGLIGGMLVGFHDHWAGNPLRVRFIVSGILIGTAGGLLASLAQLPIDGKLADAAPLLTRVLAWMLVGSLIGFGLGLRWLKVNRSRPVHAFVGGLLGGAVGGLLFAALGSRVPDLTQAAGFICIGVGICAGITLAPILLRDGLLRFVSSGDPRAQSKFGLAHKEWELQDGDTFVVGSEQQNFSSTRFRPEVEIFLPDTAIARKHATLFARDGRFYLARHPEIADQGGLARYVLKVRGRTVVQTSELNDKDDILIGRTALHFNAKAGRSRAS